MVHSLAERLRAHGQQKARLAEQEAKLENTERKARALRLIGAGHPRASPVPALQSSGGMRGRLRIRVKSGHKAGSKGSGCGSSGPGKSFMSSTY
jgi:hypothetical protein